MRPTLALLAPLALAACADDPARDANSDAAPMAQATTSPGTADAQGNSWFYRSATQTALFGPTDAEAVISLSCNLSLGDDAKVAFQWHTAARDGVEETLTVTAGERSLAFPVTGTASALGPDAIWNGEIAPDNPDLAFLARSSEPLTFSLAGQSLTAPAGEAIGQVVAACN